GMTTRRQMPRRVLLIAAVGPALANPNGGVFYGVGALMRELGAKRELTGGIGADGLRMRRAEIMNHIEPRIHTREHERIDDALSRGDVPFLKALSETPYDPPLSFVMIGKADLDDFE